MSRSRWRAYNRLLLVLLLVLLCGCTPKSQPDQKNQKLQVVATLFPLFDMARAIGGQFAEVSLFLPPGMDPHSFEPRPGDLLRLNRSDMFVYTGPLMEPWAASLLKGLDSGRLQVVTAGAGIPTGGPAEPHDNDHRHHKGADPHVWLDFTKADAMVETILAGFVARDPAHAAEYRRNAAAYHARLENLDRAYRTGLASCDSRTVIHAGHSAFSYLAGRYGLRYLSAFPASGDSEPTARQIANMIDLVRSTGSTTIYSEELVSPRLADILTRETGTRLLPLYAAHNVSRQDLERGITFPDLMERNLENLRQGLRCR